MIRSPSDIKLPKRDYKSFTENLSPYNEKNNFMKYRRFSIDFDEQRQKMELGDIIKKYDRLLNNETVDWRPKKTKGIDVLQAFPKIEKTQNMQGPYVPDSIMSKIRNYDKKTT